MKNITKISLGIIAASFFVLISGCGKTTLPAANYDSADVGKIKKVSAGTIVSMRAINVRTNENANSVDEPTPTRSHGFEYVIKLNSGAIVSIAQTEDVQLKTKQRVLVIYGTTTRVVPDDGSEDI